MPAILVLSSAKRYATKILVIAKLNEQDISSQQTEVQELGMKTLHTQRVTKKTLE